MKIKLELEFDMDDCEMSGYEFSEFMERREDILKNCVNEYFDVIGEIKFKYEVKS